jgi:hypothetical protein
MNEEALPALGLRATGKINPHKGLIIQFRKKLISLIYIYIYIYKHCKWHGAR